MVHVFIVQPSSAWIFLTKHLCSQIYLLDRLIFLNVIFPPTKAIYAFNMGQVFKMIEFRKFDDNSCSVLIYRFDIKYIWNINIHKLIAALYGSHKPFPFAVNSHTNVLTFKVFRLLDINSFLILLLN